MRSFNEFIKTAKTRVQKMIDAGLIKDKKLLDKIYDVKPEIKDSIHNRINAKAKAAAAAAKDKVENDSFVLRRKIRDAKGAISDLASRKEMAQRRLKNYSEEKKLYGKIYSGEKRKSLLSTLDSAMQPHQARYKDLDARIKKKVKALRSDRRTLNNAMSEAGKRSSLSDVTKKPMTAERYKKLSGISGLKSRPAIDTNRQLKDMGYHNSKVLSIAKKRNKNTHDGRVEVERFKKGVLGGIDAGETSSKHYMNSDFGGATIKIPAKETRRRPLYDKYTTPKNPHNRKEFQKQTARETRGVTASHEISAELAEKLKTLNALKRSGVPATKENVEAFSVASHLNPNVTLKDAENLKRLSHHTRNHDYYVRRRSSMRDKRGILYGIDDKNGNEVDLKENYLINHIINPKANWQQATQKQSPEMLSSALKKEPIQSIRKRGLNIAANLNEVNQTHGLSQAADLLSRNWAIDSPKRK